MYIVHVPQWNWKWYVHLQVLSTLLLPCWPAQWCPHPLSSVHSLCEVYATWSWRPDQPGRWPSWRNWILRTSGSESTRFIPVNLFSHSLTLSLSLALSVIYSMLEKAGVQILVKSTLKCDRRGLPVHLQWDINNTYMYYDNVRRSGRSPFFHINRLCRFMNAKIWQKTQTQC